MKYLAYRNLIGVSHTETEAKQEAEGIQVCKLPRILFTFYLSFDCSYVRIM